MSRLDPTIERDMDDVALLEGWRWSICSGAYLAPELPPCTLLMPYVWGWRPDGSGTEPRDMRLPFGGGSVPAAIQEMEAFVRIIAANTGWLPRHYYIEDAGFNEAGEFEIIWGHEAVLAG